MILYCLYIFYVFDGSNLFYVYADILKISYRFNTVFKPLDITF